MSHTPRDEMNSPGSPEVGEGQVLTALETEVGTTPASRPHRKGSLTEVLANYGVLIFLVLLIVAFSVAMPDRFPTSTNLRVMLGDNAIPGLLALAVVIPLIAGEFDLSVGATLGFTAILTAQLTINGVPVALAVLLAVLCGALVGAINALLVVSIGVNAFIATLATATILSGLNLLVTNGRTLFAGIPDSLKRIANDRLLGLEAPVYYFLGGAVVLWYLIEHTPFGRLLRATGSGREAARLTGVRTSRFLASSFIIAGAIAGLCGALQVARIGSATASIGPEFLLPAYAAAFLGSTTIKRGQFNIWGAVVGAFVLAVGITGLTFAGAPFWVPNVFNGCALIIAVSAAVLVGRRAGDEG